ncbi:MAG: L-histidine N(alpha)-methyltransferase, partial [Myxococcales bacterium]
HAARIREVAGPGALVELGSGTSTKTRRLLDAWTAAGPAAYAPIDVDVHSIEQACAGLRSRYPQLSIHGLAATYEAALAVLRGWSPMTVAFLGSSLGNLGWREYPDFCATVADALAPGDHFLVGLDLVKAPEILEAAYNDAAGVTAAFTRNLFARMNRELQTDIPADAVEHVAFYDPDRERIEIFAEARREVLIPVRALGREFRIARGERILTEVSHKFRPEAAVATVERFGFRLDWSADEDGQFGLFLFRKVEAGHGRASAGVLPGGPHKGEVRTPGAVTLGPTPLLAGVHAKLALLAEMRARTQQIVAPLSDADLSRQHSPLMSPIVWDLGHIAHFEELWLLPSADRPPDPEEALARAYDPLVTPRAGRAQLALPSTAAVRQRMREVRQRVEDRVATSGVLSLARGATTNSVAGMPGSTGSRSGTASGRPAPVSRPQLEREFALQLVAQHEAQHQETILQAIALREDLEYRPAFSADAPLPRAARPLVESVLIPAGEFVMGTDDREWAYDNERPAHPVFLPAFRMDRAPVTNGQYFAFMADDGYGRRALWSDEGWQWLQKTRPQAPGHWRFSAAQPREWAGGWEALTFGRLEPLHPDQAVVHVCWYEAAAYARWSGGRLPTEAEWEKAAAWDPARGCSRRYPWGDSPWQPGRANLDQRRLEPTHAGAYLDGSSAYGCAQMLGDVWEWTDSWFRGYPGFESFPYPEYSQIFFGDKYRVLRGGSFSTRALVARNTFRNWDLPERRQIFAGFRCVRPA